MASMPKRGFVSAGTGLGNLITTTSAAEGSGEFGQGLGELGNKFFTTKTKLGQKNLWNTWEIRF